MEQFYLARQAIYDRDMTVFAYEIFYRTADSRDAARISDPDAATSQVIMNAFLETRFDLVTCKKPAFINVTQDLLLNLEELTFPCDRIGLEIPPDIPVNDTVLSALHRWRKRGFLIVLDNFTYASGRTPLLHLADIVKLDATACALREMESQVGAIRPFGVKLLACRVETREQYAGCARMGFDFFQGFFLCRPNVLKGRRLSAGDRSGTLRLLSALHDPNASLDQIEGIISQDVTLSVRLLRYLNSPFFGFSNTVRSIRQAATLLGMRPLRNWATLVIFSRLEDQPEELVSIALVRAKLCKLLASLGPGQHKDPEAFFAAGLLSVLDALLDTTMEHALQQLPLAPELEKALLQREGEMGKVLQSVIDYEQGLMGRVSELVQDRTIANTLYVEAISWADQLIGTLRQH